jgi:hypothetical protein
VLAGRAEHDRPTRRIVVEALIRIGQVFNQLRVEEVVRWTAELDDRDVVLAYLCRDVLLGAQSSSRKPRTAALN